MRTIKHPHKKENLEKYIQGLIHGVYTLRQVANFTGYTVVHLCNLKKKYQQRGAAIFINGHKGMMPKNKISENTKEKIIEIYQTQFVDSDTGNSANFLFFTKILKDLYDINYSYRTIYNILIKAGFISPEKHKIKKNTKIHRPRFRRECGGELVQLDATPYQWFLWSGDKNYYTLHGAIDDAEEKITGLTMSQNECSYGYYDVMEQTCLNFGLPAEVYTDRSSIFCVTPRNKDKLTVQEQLAGLHEKRTQWQRILSDLEVKQILAWSPQAKGRIERMWRTLQGRLPWYFKKYKIKTIEAANDFLKNQFIKIFNSEFGLQRNNQTVWRKPPENLSEILCSKFRRRVNSAGILSFQGYNFLVKAPHCVCRDIEICINCDGIKACVDGKYYPMEILDELTGGIGEAMSDSLKEIIYKYMYTDAKKISA